MSEFFRNSIKPEYHSLMYACPKSRPKIKFKTNFTNCIGEGFEKKGFERTDNDNWDIIWS